MMMTMTMMTISTQQMLELLIISDILVVINDFIRIFLKVYNLTCEKFLSPNSH